MSIWESFKQRVAGTPGREHTEGRQIVTAEEKIQIEQMLTEGYTPEEIAKALDRNYKTVFAHITAARRMKAAPTAMDRQREEVSIVRSEVEKVRLEIEKVKLQGEMDKVAHERKIQELQLKRELAELERGDDDDDDGEEGFSAESILGQILAPALTPLLEKYAAQLQPQGEGLGAEYTPPPMHVSIPTNEQAQEAIIARYGVPSDKGPPQASQNQRIAELTKSQVRAIQKLLRGKTLEEAQQLAASKGYSPDDVAAFKEVHGW